jgi:hypothetical protein
MAHQGWASSVAVAAWIGFTTGASATDITTPRRTCTGVNCGALKFAATINAFTASTRASPWTVGVLGQANECVRLQVILQVSDLEMVVVGPDGTVWRNDNGNVSACPTCPVVKFVPLKTGWYTVQVSPANGSAVEQDFRISYGRYNVGNPNCRGLTPTF